MKRKLRMYVLMLFILSILAACAELEQGGTHPEKIAWSGPGWYVYVVNAPRGQESECAWKRVVGRLESAPRKMYNLELGPYNSRERAIEEAEDENLDLGCLD